LTRQETKVDESVKEILDDSNTFLFAPPPPPLHLSLLLSVDDAAELITAPTQKEEPKKEGIIEETEIVTGIPSVYSTSPCVTPRK
jgi:hypothetical protein